MRERWDLTLTCNSPRCVLSIGTQAQLDHSPICFLQGFKKACKFCCATKTKHQNPACLWIQRTGMADCPYPYDTAHSGNRIMRCHAPRLIKVEDTIKHATCHFPLVL